MVKSVRKSAKETCGIVGRFHRFEDLAGKRVYVIIGPTQHTEKIKNKTKKKNRTEQNKQNKQKGKNLAFGVKRAKGELNQNRQEQASRMKYLLIEIK